MRTHILEYFKEHWFCPKEFLSMKPYESIGWLSHEDFVESIAQCFNEVDLTECYQEIIDFIWNNRDFSDYAAIYSVQKAEFRRSWYHNHSYTHVSLDRPNVADGDVGSIHNNAVDYQADFEETALFKLKLEHFKSTISEKDWEILRLRLKDRTFQQIADELGYKTHSAVQKRIAKLGEKYLAFEEKYYSEYIDNI